MVECKVPVYNDDYETNAFEYPTGEDIIDEQNQIVPPPAFPQHPSYVSPSLEVDVVPGNVHNTSGSRPCDRRVDLYILQPERLNTSGQSNPLKGKLTNCHVTGCERYLFFFQTALNPLGMYFLVFLFLCNRPFSVQKIPHSNLILLVVDTLCPCGSKQLSILPQEINYDGSKTGGNGGTCHHKPHDSLYRRRPPKCINYHPEVRYLNAAFKA